jgi:hypothetical protein
VVVVTIMPMNDCTCRRICPEPSQTLQVFTEVPALMPDREQLSQPMAVSMVRPLVIPKTASVKSN